MPKVRDGGYMSRVSLTSHETSLLASRVGGSLESVHDLCSKVAAVVGAAGALLWVVPRA